MTATDVIIGHVIIGHVIIGHVITSVHIQLMSVTLMTHDGRVYTCMRTSLVAVYVCKLSIVSCHLHTTSFVVVCW